MCMYHFCGGVWFRCVSALLMCEGITYVCYQVSYMWCINYVHECVALCVSFMYVCESHMCSNALFMCEFVVGVTMSLMSGCVSHT